jgi:molybdenum cofactor cytidylyltransferase
MEVAPMISAIVLAAGMSERMGSPKPLLEIGGRTFIESVCGRIWEAGAGEVVVVLGARHELVEEKVDFPREKVAVNDDYLLGQLSSLKVGMEMLDGSSSHFLLALVDHPLVKTTTYRKLMRECGTHGDSIVIPVFRGRRGHPVVFPRPLYLQLLEAPLAIGARYVVQRNLDRIVEIDVDDGGILADIDTREDFKIHV